jgi:hypothetical protein
MMRGGLDDFQAEIGTGAENALEWGRVRLPVDDDHSGFYCDNEQITLEVERADGLATGAECVCRA